MVCGWTRDHVFYKPFSFRHPDSSRHGGGTFSELCTALRHPDQTKLYTCRISPFVYSCKQRTLCRGDRQKRIYLAQQKRFYLALEYSPNSSYSEEHLHQGHVGGCRRWRECPVIPNLDFAERSKRAREIELRVPNTVYILCTGTHISTNILFEKPKKEVTQSGQMPSHRFPTSYGIQSHMLFVIISPYSSKIVVY